MSNRAEAAPKGDHEKNGGQDQQCAHLEWVEGLHLLSRTITGTPDVSAIIDKTLESAQSVLNLQSITVRLRNPITGDLDAVACKNLDETEWKSSVPKGALGLSGVVAESAGPIMICDLQNHPNVRRGAMLRRLGLVSYLGIPFIVNGRVAGVIGYYSKNPRGFRSDEVQYLTALTDLAAVGLHDAALREENAEQAGQLRRANLTALKSEKLKTEFLGVMSHEFRTPLNLIMGYAGMMQEGMLGELNDEQRASLERIIRCSDDLLAMVISILEASMIEAGAVRVQNQDFDPMELAADLKGRTVVPVGKDIETVWQWPTSLPRLRTDREKLTQALEHLIDNAVKFCNRGRVVISAEGTSKPSMVKFAVADTGIGIAPEALPFVFEKFRQSDSSTTRRHGGVGLGLYIAKKFIELLGGELDVRSQLGVGTTFTVSLPAGN
ncbi:MAG TPA: GAF domain-containing sensor histidine kinase [Methylomirabilota bacterium]|nr:GAF domain-containing sensor histidine kinase [Methylomirabilota bacterium]